MKSTKVYVVTSLEAGWDCVVGVFDSTEVMIEELEACFPEGQYVIFEKEIELNLNDWEE